MHIISYFFGRFYPIYPFLSPISGNIYKNSTLFEVDLQYDVKNVVNNSYAKKIVVSDPTWQVQRNADFNNKFVF